LHQIDINTATKEELRSHPYIRWQLAQEIIEYRQQHGAFRSVDELLVLAQMNPEKFEKLKPYLVANHE
jgi:competence ComEA-like helix-hairpin-helix protein